MRRRAELIGWLLFLVCAMAYLAAALRDGDVLLSLGGAAFLVACVVFLFTYWRD